MADADAAMGRQKQPFKAADVAEADATPLMAAVPSKRPPRPPAGISVVGTNAPQQTAPWFDHQTSDVAVPLHPRPG
jgi:hypothetical protein